MRPPLSARHGSQLGLSFLRPQLAPLGRSRATPPEDAGCNLDPGREGPGSRAPPGYLLFFICFLLPGRRRKAQRKGKERTEAARAAAPVPSGCAGARREARYFSLQIGSLRGLAATRKCILALRAAEGAGQGRHSPAQPRASTETLGTRRGPAAGGVTSPSFFLLPFHVGPATWGDASSGGPRHRPPGGPGSIRPPPRPLSRPALYSAPRLQLPPGPRAGHGCRPRLVRSGAGRPQGALALPDPRSGRPCQGGSAGCGCARRLVCVLELATMCSLREAKCFYTFRNVFLLSECRWGYFESLALVRSPASLRPCGPRGRVCSAISRSRVHKCLGALRLKSGLSTTMGHSGRARLASIWAGFLGHDPQHLSAVPGREPAPCAQGPPGLPDFKRASSKDPCGAKQSPCMQLF